MKKINIILVTTLLVSSPLFAKNIFSRNKNKNPEEPEKSRNFVAFDNAAYHTSPDKRIGAKILVDINSVGPSIAAMTHLTYLPGAKVPSHRHVYVTEILYILDGNLTVRVGNETKIVGKDSTVFIPPRTFHELMNDSADVVKFLQYYSPSGAEEEYRNWENPKTSEAKALAKEIEKKVERENAEPEKLIAPPPLTVPGSPTKVKIDEVKIEKTAEKKTEEISSTTESDEEISSELKKKLERNNRIKELLLNLKPKTDK